MPSAASLKFLLRRQRDGIRFCVLFALLYTVLVFAVLYAAQTALIDPLNRHLAWMTRTALGLFGAHTASSGAVVTLGTFAVEI